MDVKIRFNTDYSVDKSPYKWRIIIDDVQHLVDTFRGLCPSITHRVTMDWDNESLYKIRFTWEPGTFGVKKPIPVLLKAIKTKCDESTPPTPRPPSGRYGGPRW